MELKQLDTFVRVAELGSFTRAAAVLRVAQPALSRQVRALEVELRQPLFERNGRGVTLTEAGKRLLAHGRGILQQVQRARQDLDEQRGAASGLLSLGLPPSLSRTLTAPLVEAFRARFPKATLSMVEGLSTYMLEWLAEGRLDCALVYNATPTPALDLQPLLDEQLYLVCPREAAAGGRARPATGGAAPSGRVQRGASAARGARTKAAAAPGALIGRPLTMAELAGRDLVIPSRPHALRMRVETALATAGLKPRVALEIESVPAILDLVLRHPMNAVLALNALVGSAREAELAARPIHTAPGQPLTTTVWVATSALRPRGPLLEQALPLVKELLTQQGQAQLAVARKARSGLRSR